MFDTHIMYSRKCGATARAIRDEFEILGVPTTFSEDPPNNRDTNIIRWGTSRKGIKVNGVVFNSRSAIARSTDKYRTLEVLRDSGDIVWHVPQFHKNPRALLHFLGRNAPIVWRGKNHSHGRDFEYIENLGEATHNTEDDGYYMAYIDKAREYRVFATPYKALIVYEKKPMVEEPDNYRWNMEFGYRQEQIKDITLSTLGAIHLAIDSVKALGLDFGAVDILETKDGEVYVIECNTAPTLGEYSLPIVVSHMVSTLWPNGIENDGD